MRSDETNPAPLRIRGESAPVDMSARRPGRQGSASEMLVMVDLLKRGFEVYQAVSPQAASDLIVEIGADLYRVEVKTVERTETGRPATPRGNLGRKGHQLLAIVDAVTGAVRYEIADATVEQCAALLDALPFPALTPAQEHLIRAQALLRLLRRVQDQASSFSESEREAWRVALTELLPALRGAQQRLQEKRERRQARA